VIFKDDDVSPVILKLFVVPSPTIVVVVLVGVLEDKVPDKINSLF
jgi:hypothetical protein